MRERGVRDLTAAADRAGNLGETTATDVQAALDKASGSGPSGRVPLIDAVSAASDRLQEGLREIDIGAGGWLVPPLKSARSDFARALAKADTRLDDGRHTLVTLRDFLSGPRRYLILAEIVSLHYHGASRGCRGLPPTNMALRRLRPGRQPYVLLPVIPPK